MSFIIGLLRVLRAVLGFLGAMALLTSCSLVTSGNPQAIGFAIIKIAAGLLLLTMFIVLRWGINRLHRHKSGEPDPALAKFWSL